MKNEQQLKKYQKVVQKMLTNFPELKPELNELMENWDGEFPGLHIIMGDVFNPLLKKKLKEDRDKVKLNQLFEFVEEIVSSDNDYISEVGVVTICESIVFAGPKAYRDAILYAQSKTKKSLHELYNAFYIRRDDEKY